MNKKKVIIAIIFTLLILVVIYKNQQNTAAAQQQAQEPQTVKDNKNNVGVSSPPTSQPSDSGKQVKDQTLETWADNQKKYYEQWVQFLSGNK